MAKRAASVGSRPLRQFNRGIPQQLGHRLDVRQLCPLCLPDLQFVDPLSAWFDFALIAANCRIVSFAGLIEALADFVKMPNENTESVSYTHLTLPTKA